MYKQFCLLFTTLLFSSLLQSCSFNQQFSYNLQDGGENPDLTLALNTEEAKREDNSSLLVAAIHGKLDVVQKLLSKPEVNPNIQDNFYNTALHHAILNGHLHIAALLLEHGADPNIADGAYHTPLYYLVEPKYIASNIYAHSGISVLDMVSLFMDKGAKYDRPDFYKKTPFSVALVGGQLEIINLFLDYTNNINQLEFQDYDGDYYLDINSSQPNLVNALHLIAETDNVDMATLLLNKGADINQGDLYGVRPVHRAIACGKVNMVTCFLAHGADLTLTDKYGNNPLHFLSNFPGYSTAKLHKTTEILELLLNAGVLHTTNEHGQTPLHRAAQRNHVALIEALVEKSFDNMMVSDKDDKSFLDFVKKKNIILYGSLLKQFRNKYLTKLKEFAETEGYHALLNHEHQLILQLIVDYTLFDSIFEYLQKEDMLPMEISRYPMPFPAFLFDPQGRPF
jgi:ankyrin repeat protein